MNGPAKGYYPDGKLRYEFTFYDNFIDGVFKEYYPTGELYKLYNYNQGYLNGDWFIYYKDGKNQRRAMLKTIHRKANYIIGGRMEISRKSARIKITIWMG